MRDRMTGEAQQETHVVRVSNARCDEENSVTDAPDIGAVDTTRDGEVDLRGIHSRCLTHLGKYLCRWPIAVLRHGVVGGLPYLILKSGRGTANQSEGHAEDCRGSRSHISRVAVRRW